MSSWPICSICSHPVESKSIDVCETCWQEFHDNFNVPEPDDDAASKPKCIRCKKLVDCDQINLCYQCWSDGHTGFTDADVKTMLDNLVDEVSNMQPIEEVPF